MSDQIVIRRTISRSSGNVLSTSQLGSVLVLFSIDTDRHPDGRKINSCYDRDWFKVLAPAATLDGLKEALPVAVFNSLWHAIDPANQLWTLERGSKCGNKKCREDIDELTRRCHDWADSKVRSKVIK